MVFSYKDQIKNEMFILKMGAFIAKLNKTKVTQSHVTI